MLDTVLIPLIINTLIAGEAIAGIPDLPIAAAFQPTQQGVNTEPTAYIYKVGDKRYGFPFWGDVWDADLEVMVHTQSQQYESTFQLSALATQNPKTPSAYTASDILNQCAAILQSQTAVATFEVQGVGILRVTDVRNPYFINDKGRQEAAPSFDFVMTHKQIIISATPTIQNVELKIIEV